MTVLIVEDDQNLLTLLSYMFKRFFPKARVITDNGEHKNLVKLVHTEKVDLIILDLILPYFSGTDLIRKLKESKKSNNTAIIVVSAKVLTKDVVEHLSLGVDDYVKKPFDTRELTARIKAVLHRRGIVV